MSPKQRPGLPTRAAGALLRWSGRRVVVPRTTIGSQEYARRYSGRWHTAYPAAGRVSRRPPIQYGSRIADFDSPVDPVPELGVLELPRGNVVGVEGWIVSREGDLLPEHTWYGTHTAEMEHRLRRGRQPHRVERVGGTALSLGTRSADSNYGHFLLDSVGRLALVEKAGIRMDGIDHVVGAVPSERARRILKRAGVPLDRFIVAREGVSIQPDVLLAPTFPGTRRNYQPWLVEFLRKTGPAPAAADVAGRRLYIQRKATRRVLNEAQLLPTLEEHGFEIYDPAEHPDPPADFAAASIVVGAHGAGLADLAFCRPGTCVLELIPEDHVMPYWYTVSEAGGLRYGYLIGDVHPSPLGASKSDLTVDVNDFGVALADTVAAEVRR
jgi:hypothetical protein